MALSEQLAMKNFPSQIPTLSGTVIAGNASQPVDLLLSHVFLSLLGFGGGEETDLGAVAANDAGAIGP